MRTKPLYLHRVSDRAFYVYRLSSYARTNIELIKACVAFDNTGNYTKEVKSLIKKYDLNKYYSSGHVTASSFQDFTDSLYLSSKQVGILVETIPIPPVVFSLIEASYNRNEQKEEAKFLRDLEKFSILIKDKKKLQRVLDNLTCNLQA